MDNQPVSPDQLFWAWLAGFSDGEACFSITYTGGSGSAYGLNYKVGLRADDWRILKSARDRTGLGDLRKVLRKDGWPQIAWEIRSNAGCAALRDGLLSGGGLMAKKAQDFAIWSQAIDLIYRYGGGKHSPVGDQLEELKAKLHQVKLFSHELAAGYETFNGAGFMRKDEGRPRPMAQLERVVSSSRRMAVASKEFWVSDAGAISRGKRQQAYAKLTQEQIDEIIRRIDAGERRTPIAKEFGVSVGLLAKFMRGDYLRRDGTLQRNEAQEVIPATSPEFWETEAGQRAKRSNAALRGKISQEKIDELVLRVNAGESKHKLAAEYGVSRPLITKFVRGDYVRRD